MISLISVPNALVIITSVVKLKIIKNFFLNRIIKTINSVPRKGIQIALINKIEIVSTDINNRSVYLSTNKDF